MTPTTFDQSSTADINSLDSPHCCGHCEKIVVHEPVDENKQSFGYDQVTVAASEGCSLFKRQLEKASPWDADSRRLLVLEVSPEFDENSKLLHVHFQWFPKDATWRDADGDIANYNAFVTENDPMARQIPSRPLNLTPSSPRTVSQIQEWLRECATHQICRRVWTEMTSEVRPTRVLELRADEKPSVRLINFADTDLDRDAKYVALSYCWGKNGEEQKGVCTKTNIDAFKRGVSMLDLPRTVQDAVQVARQLGLKYLWVDRLCIIQDDDDDKKKEIRKMTDIYTNAHLVISAANAGHSDQGFIHDRKASEAHGNIWRVAFEGSKKRGFVLLCETALQNSPEEKIDERAWTMQEHTMAIRLLRYGSRQIEWICPRKHAVDGGCDFFATRDDPQFFTERVETRRPYAQRSIDIEDPIFDMRCNMDNWTRALSRYSQRQIGKQSDRLPAIAAFAASFARTMGWDSTSYFAGLWEWEFMLQLLWYPTSGVDIKPDSCAEAPSWSWASFPGSFTFFQLAGYPTEALLIGRPELSLLDDGNYFGRVSAGSLTIAGYLQKCRQTKDGMGCVGGDVSNITTRRCVHIYWNQEKARVLENIWFFVVADAAKNPVGLVLQLVEQRVHLSVAQSDGRETFRRVGYFKYHEYAETGIGEDAPVDVIRTSISPEDLCRDWKTLNLV